MRTELDKIATADELQIAPLRRNGTLRKPVTIWVVRVGDDLYVRSAYGSNAGWLRRIQMQHEARIRAGDLEKDVIVLDADPNLNDEIDARVPHQVPPPRRNLRQHDGQPRSAIHDDQTRAALVSS
jgi:hypothetical protein